ncbi:MAG: bifunctional phosphoglucose/phosphomannose isomerase [bacterium]
MNEVNLRVLDDVAYIGKLDASNMLSRLVTFSRQCQEAIEIGVAAHLPIDPSAISNVVISGLGGSAIGGDILCACLADEMKVPIQVNRNYSLPRYVSPSSLLFVLSYSGNTEETLRVFETAIERGVPLVCITSGGRLGELAAEEKKWVIRIPSGYPPRTALGYLFFPVLMILSRAGLIEDKKAQLIETIALLGEKAEEYGSSVPVDRNEAKRLAGRLCGLFPLLYASESFSPVARRWKTQIAENAKALAYSNVFPELNHNEIMGWQGLVQLETSFTVVILRDKGDLPQIQRRMEISRELIESDGLPVIEVWSQGDSPLARLFSLVCLGDFVSFYLAVLRGIDPTPVERIEYLKRRLVEMESREKRETRR